MANAASLTGLMCRILLLSSVAYNDQNKITVEFSTPRFLDPPSMFFCFTSTSFVVSTSTFDVVDLTEGGSIFSITEEKVFPSSFLSSNGALNAIEISTIYEVLATDPYYAGSYKLQRYDDLVVDQEGISIDGVVDFPVNLNVTAGPPLFFGNCFLLSGSWKRNTRYQMNISVVNLPPPETIEVPWPPPPPPVKKPPSPPHRNQSSPRPPPLPGPPSPPPGPPFMEISNNATPILWVAPVSFDFSSYTSKYGIIETLLFSIRGNKYGAACPLREPILPTMGAMFDACAESQKRGLGPDGNETATVDWCLARLRSVASLPANKGTLPFTAPPLTSYNLSSFAATSCSLPNTVVGPRFGGECISCGTNGYVESGECLCPPNVLPNLLGPVACGEAITPDGSVASLTALPAWLCANFTAAQAAWESKQLLAHNIAKQYKDMFLQLASPLLDYADMFNAFQQFNATYIFDDRRPNSPTRRWGIKPNCDECTNGYFKDTFTKTEVPVFDWHFDAMNTLRFLGYVLNMVLGTSCPALWDSRNPMEWRYGYYNQIICKAMPPGTCCGDNFFG